MISMRNGQGFQAGRLLTAKAGVSGKFKVPTGMTATNWRTLKEARTQPAYQAVDEKA